MKFRNYARSCSWLLTLSLLLPLSPGRVLAEEGLNPSPHVAGPSSSDEGGTEQPPAQPMSIQAVTASGSEAELGSEVLPEHVIDGREDSRWSAPRMKKRGQGPELPQQAQWLSLDLGAKTVNLEAVELQFYKKVWAMDYQLETSADGKTWRPLGRHQFPAASQEDNFCDRWDFSDLAVSRYLRMYFHKVNTAAAGNSVSLTEVRVYGSPTETDEQPENPTVKPEETESWDLAAGKPVRASSVEAALPQNVAAMVVDQNPQTRWSSERMKDSGTREGEAQTAQWLLLDTRLADIELDRIEIDFFKKVWPSSYRIQTADEAWPDADWRDLKTIVRPAGSLPDNPQDRILASELEAQPLGRYIRLYFEAVNVQAGGSGVSVTELRIFGRGRELRPEELGPETAQEALNQIQSLPAYSPNLEQISFPDVGDYEIRVVGSTKTQLVSKEGRVSHHALEARTVTLLIEARSRRRPEDRARKNLDFDIQPGTDFYGLVLPRGENPRPRVIPGLQEWLGGSGYFSPTAQTRLIYNDRAGLGLRAAVEDFAQDFLRLTGLDLSIEEGEEAVPNSIFFTSQSEDVYELGPEGYMLEIRGEGVRIFAPTYRGALYGAVSVNQMIKLSAEERRLPQGLCRDYPDYEVRGVMFDLGRIPHRLQYLQDYTQILKWYKMNEYHLHLNESFDYSPSTQYPRRKTEWSGMHRLESKAFPSLAEHHAYSLPEHQWFNEVYKDPIYSQAEYRALEAQAGRRGIDMLPEFDSPGHANRYIQYAAQNPDQISWLGPLDSVVWKGGEPLLAIDTESENAEERSRAERSRRFMETLLADYLEGPDPCFKSQRIHLGADEYWNTKQTEAFRRYTNFLDGIARKYDKKLRVWGALRKFQGTTPISPENIELDMWATYEDDPLARLNEGFQLVNVPQPYLYTTPGRDHKDMVLEERVYKDWSPLVFNAGVEAQLGEPNILGGKAAVWGDEFREGMIETDLHERMLRAVAITAEKTWQARPMDPDFAAYRQAFNRLQEGPGTAIAMEHRVAPGSSTIAAYDPSCSRTEDGALVLEDLSANGYAAKVSGGELRQLDGETWLHFDGGGRIDTPLGSKSYPCTLTMELIPEAEQPAGAKILDGYDGQLLVQAEDGSGQLQLRRSFFNQQLRYQLQPGKRQELCLIGNQHSTRLYVNGELKDHLYSSDAGQDDPTFFSSFVLPLEQLLSAYRGYVGSIRLLDRSLDLPRLQEEKEAERYMLNLALNRDSVAERLENNPDVRGRGAAYLKRHPEFKAFDGMYDSEQQGGLGVDPNSFWASSRRAAGAQNGDYLFVDLGQPERIDVVELRWKTRDGVLRQALDYDLLTSLDAQNWEPLGRFVDQTGAVHRHPLSTPRQARYVKFQGLRQAQDAYELEEFLVLQLRDRSSLQSALDRALSLRSKEESQAQSQALARARWLLADPYSSEAELARAAADLELHYPQASLPGDAPVSPKKPLSDFAASLPGDTPVSPKKPLSDFAASLPGEAPESPKKPLSDFAASLPANYPTATSQPAGELPAAGSSGATEQAALPGEAPVSPKKPLSDFAASLPTDYPTAKGQPAGKLPAAGQESGRFESSKTSQRLPRSGEALPVQAGLACLALAGLGLFWKRRRS